MENDYATGVSEIDFQRRYFFLLIKRLKGMIINDAEKIHIFNLLDELAKYAAFHFASQENHMILADYDHLFQHKLAHLKLLEELNVLKAKYELFGTGLDKIVPFLT